MQTQTTTVSKMTRPAASFTEHLMADLEAHPYWTELQGKAEALEAAGKAKKKSRFESIVEKKDGGTFYANPTFFKMKEGWNFRSVNSPKFIQGIKILAKQIASEGVKMPVKAFHEGNDPTFWLEDGHRRMIALAYAIVHEDYAPEALLIPFRMGDKAANDTDRLFSQFRDNQSEKPTPFEMARIFARMVGMGAKKEDIASRAGISKSNVIRLLDMATVPAALQAFTETDIEVSDSFVHKLYTATDKNADLAVKALETAIITAKDQEYDRVMPKHLPADIQAMYNGEEKGKGKGKKGSTAAPAPAPTPANDPTPENPEKDATTEDQGNSSAGDTTETTPAGKTDTSAKGQTAAPEQQPANDTKASTTKAAATGSTAQKGSTPPELPVQQSNHASAGERNIKFRAAMTEFFKTYCQIDPINPDHPEAPRKITLLKDQMEAEMSFAILHNLNLN